jgi:hypothetical protein
MTGQPRPEDGEIADLKQQIRNLECLLGQQVLEVAILKDKLGAPVRAREATPAQNAADLGVALDEVQQWMFVHADDGVVSLSETRANTFLKHQQNTWG